MKAAVENRGWFCRKPVGGRVTSTRPSDVEDSLETGEGFSAVIPDAKPAASVGYSRLDEENDDFSLA